MAAKPSHTDFYRKGPSGVTVERLRRGVRGRAGPPEEQRSPVKGEDAEVQELVFIRQRCERIPELKGIVDLRQSRDLEVLDGAWQGKSIQEALSLSGTTLTSRPAADAAPELQEAD